MSFPAHQLPLKKETQLLLQSQLHPCLTDPLQHFLQHMRGWHFYDHIFFDNFGLLCFAFLTTFPSALHILPYRLNSAYKALAFQDKSQTQGPNLEAGDDKSTKAPREGTPPGRAGEALALEQQRTKELQDNSQRAEMYERLRYMENPMLFELCGTLFDDKKRSVWSGSHSLVQNELSTCKSTLLSAITSFMK